MVKIPQPHGGALNAGGTPGNKGGTGRPPNWLKEWCDDLLADADAKAQVEAILKDNKHQAYATMWKAVAERAHGKPKETVEHTGAITQYVVEAPSKFTDRTTWQRQYTHN